jgi:hypothetical protein
MPTECKVVQSNWNKKQWAAVKDNRGGWGSTTRLPDSLMMVVVVKENKTDGADFAYT